MQFINHKNVEVLWHASENNGITKHKHAVAYRPKHENSLPLSLSLSRNVFSMHMEIQFNKIAKLLSDECYNAMDEPTAENESFGWLHII